MTLMEQVARDAFPHGAHLKCTNPECDRGERVTQADCARYLANGWPTHCGATMGCEKAAPAESR